MTWRPLPERDGTRPPKRLSRSLEQLMGPIALVLAHWQEAAGALLALHAAPLRIDGDCLVIVVDHSQYASEVRWLGPSILARLAELAGEPVAQQIEVRVSSV